MSKTYVLVILASEEESQESTETRHDERTLRKYFENQTVGEVKICYVSETATPGLYRQEFLDCFEELLEPIRQNDWLVIIYSGIYSSSEEGGAGLEVEIEEGAVHHSFSMPFEVNAKLNEYLLAQKLKERYLKSSFRILFIIDAFHDDSPLNLNHPPWSALEIVEIVAQKYLQPTSQFTQGGLLINTLIAHLSDIGTHLSKREKSPPSITQIFQAIERQWQEEQLIAVESQSQSDSSSSDSQSDIIHSKVYLKIMTSPLGKSLLDHPIPF